MANLFWKTQQGIKALLATPFKTEDEFERTVFDASELLEDIFPLKRQIRGSRVFPISLVLIAMATSALWK